MSTETTEDLAAPQDGDFDPEAAGRLVDLIAALSQPRARRRPPAPPPERVARRRARPER